MGIHDFPKKDGQTDEAVEPQKQVKAQSDYAGWQAIKAAFEQVYPGQATMRQLSAGPSRLEGGDQAIDAISVYDGGDYWHFVTMGLSDIYDQGYGELPEISRFGMEFTYKIKKYEDDVEREVVLGTAHLLHSLANLTVDDDEIFGPYEYLTTGQTEGVDVHQTSKLTGFICVPDSEVAPIETPNGRVAFIEFVGVTYDELQSLAEAENTKEAVEALYNQLPEKLTDYRRESTV